MNRWIITIFALVVLVGMGNANGAIFFDNFDSENHGVGALNYNSFTNWTVSDGTVDLIGNGFYDLQPGHGLYVDMDGSTMHAGKMITSTSISLEPGTYELSYLLAGNLRAPQSDSVIIQVTVGPLVDKTRSLTWNTPFTSFFDIFTVLTPMDVNISFQGTGGDNIGMLLDDVQLNTIPEPTTLIIWSLLGGLGIVFVKWRRGRKGD